MTQASTQTRTVTESPVDNPTYNLMQALTSKLEAIEAYETYREDGDAEAQQLFDDLLRDERQHAERLLAALRNRMR
ncbi:MAG TPA: ferritin family protein [Candidatus Limnocylindria bacterium]|nr:ferritin family protein [Candidatus Limnocylindria bacterium]